MYVRDYDDNLVKHSRMIHQYDGESEDTLPTLPSIEVASFMDQGARTITEDTEFLQIARIFLDTPYRRLPVLRNRALVGQISRRDLLQVAHNMMAITPKKRGAELLYLSSLMKRDEASMR